MLQADPRPVRALMLGGPLDGEAHDLPHGGTEWRALVPPADVDGEVPLSQLPRDVYLRDADPAAVTDDGKPVYRYRYAGRKAAGS